MCHGVGVSPPPSRQAGTACNPGGDFESPEVRSTSERCRMSLKDAGWLTATLRLTQTDAGWLTQTDAGWLTQTDPSGMTHGDKGHHGDRQA